MEAAYKMKKINSNKRALIIGSAVIDVVAKIKTLPISGEDIAGEIMESTVGGCAYNVANVLSQLNAKYDLLVPVGNGKNADIIKKEFIQKGHQILISDNSMDNGWNLSLVEENGERTFITFSGLEDNWKEEWFTHTSCKQYDYIYLSGYSLEQDKEKAIINFLKRHGNSTTILFDPSPRITAISSYDLSELFKLGPIIHCNNHELLALMGSSNRMHALEKLYEQTQNDIIVTLGAKGAAYYNGSSIIKVAGLKTNMVDTIGAGDAHTGAFLAALLDGKDVETACIWGNIAATQAVSIQGGNVQLSF